MDRITFLRSTNAYGSCVLANLADIVGILPIAHKDKCKIILRNGWSLDCDESSDDIAERLEQRVEPKSMYLATGEADNSGVFPSEAFLEKYDEETQRAIRAEFRKITGFDYLGK
jgi:hypothetical protein